MPSSVPVVKAALKSLIETALPTTHFMWANGGADLSRECVWMGSAEFSGEEIAALRVAPHPHTEVYIVPVVVYALSEGNDPQTAEERGWAFAASVEDALRLAPTLGVAGVHWARVSGKAPTLYTRDNGWAMFVDMSVAVQARI